MYDEADSPRTKALSLAAFKAGLAWGRVVGMPRWLPEGRTPHQEQLDFFTAVLDLASATESAPATVERRVRDGHAFFMHSLEGINNDVIGECPEHPPIQDLCHGTFGELFPTLTEFFNVTPSEALAIVTEAHQATHPECRGFTATPEALAGCTNPPLAF